MSVNQPQNGSQPAAAAARGRDTFLQRFVGLVIVTISPAAAAIALLSVLITERLEIDQDLQLFFPPSVRPGDTVPVRALLLGHLTRMQGPELIDASIRVQLLDPAGKVADETRLEPALGRTREGLLRAPAGREGRFRLHAIARLGERRVMARAGLRVDARSGPVGLRVRDLGGPLQRFASGEIRAAAAGEPPSALEVRLKGGFCVPEQRCELLVRVGEPPAAVVIEGNASVTPLNGSDEPSQQSSGIIALRVVTHGPEAVLTLRALRDREPVASRQVRLPVVLASSALRVSKTVYGAREQPAFRLEEKGEGRGCMVDGYLENRWLFAGSKRQCATWSALPFRVQQPGIWRLQAGRDPFGGESIAARLFYLSPAGQRDGEALRAVARFAIEKFPDDAYARDLIRRPQRVSGSDLQKQAAFLLAPQESLLAPLPVAAASYPHQQAELDRKRETLRVHALVALALAGLVLVAYVLLRGLAAASRARAIMAAAGDPSARGGLGRARATLTVLAAALCVALAFVAAAMYVIARAAVW